MGNYNSQYESYYSNMINRRRSYNFGVNKKNKFKLDWNFIIKRLQRDLIGIFILFISILMCKIISTPQTAYAYNYSKDIVNQNFDYSLALNNLKNFDYKKLESKVSDFIDETKSKIVGGKTFKERLKTDFRTPVENALNITKDDQLKDGIDIFMQNGSNILAVFDGKVKDCGEDSKFGKYIIIDHGSGIESKYAKLKELSFKKGDAITKGEVLGKVEDSKGDQTSFLHFELSYMGESLNPEDYLSFSKQ